MTLAKPFRSLALGIAAAAALFVVAQAVRRDAAERIITAPPPASASGSRTSYPEGEFPHLTLPDGRREPVRSVLNVSGPLRFGTFVWRDEDVPPGPVWVYVDLDRQLLSAFRGGHEIGSAVILYGATSNPSPTGAFPVIQKAKDYHSRTYDAPMPFMLRLTADGVAIHGSNVRDGAATHGCIGVPTQFARKLFDQVGLGATVVIVGSPPQGAEQPQDAQTISRPRLPTV